MDSVVNTMPTGQPDSSDPQPSQHSRRSSGSIKGWDVFESTIRDEYDSEWALYDKAIKIIKLIVLLLTSAIVLVSSLVSKGFFLLMASMTGKHRLTVCNLKISALETDRRYYINLEPESPNERDNVINEKIAWTWALFFCLIVPEFLTFLRSFRSIFSSASKWPNLQTFLVIFTMESFRALGIGLLTFYILPSLNCIFGLMLTSSLCLLPIFLQLISLGRETVPRNVTITHAVSFGIQLISLAVWPVVYHFFQESEDKTRLALIPLVLIMISLGWIENYLPNESRFIDLSKLREIRETLRDSRYLIYLLVAPWKVFIWLMIMIAVYHGEYNISSSQLFTKFSNFYQEHLIVVKEDSDLGSSQLIASGQIHIHLMIGQMVASLLCYIFGKFACKICVQTSSFALPISLTTPLLVSILILACHTKNKFVCLVYDYIPFLPGYVFWFCPDHLYLENWRFLVVLGFWFLTFIAQIWTSLHIWSPPQERTSRTEKLFISPLYSAAFIDQSLAFNRRREEEKIINESDLNQTQSLTGGLVNFDEVEMSDHVVRDSDKITRIYACVTMWHETSDEMLQTLKSMMKMDEDQSARENAQKYLKVVDPDYYQFETHVLFDDAFEFNDDDEMVVNQYVRTFIEVMNEAVSAVHKTHLKLRPPTVIPTPYGGRLIWTLPGKTKVIVHLKDRAKIRHRKRWSQVMYMYYLLGHLLMDSSLHINRKAARGENTYLLALDGDIVFDPSAVLLLVDLMKKEGNLGAACGRIHPVGTGMMVWYQKFEYAVSHWLQKAAEHVFGCVLCSPGAFSLFRARALMSPNVMKRYTAEAKEPVDFIQHDQGEDRWLCTLLLQSGYRVEYNAASDAFTHCPEGFNEFYIQRRRWAPSTMANIIDLLSGYKNLVAINRDISYPYIAYQVFLMIGTILGPGTILLMLVGAVNSVFGLDNTKSLIINLVPIILFIIVCFVAKNDVQLFLAQILSALYVFLMLAVFIGTAIQIQDEPFSPSTIFFVIMILTFVMASLLHPREISCFLSFPLYMLCIPSMYLLLTLYALINLNVVSWGTREAPKRAKKNAVQQEAAANVVQKSNNLMMGWLSFAEKRKSTEASISFSFGNIFRCLMCTRDNSSNDSLQLVRVEEAIRDLSNKINLIAEPSRKRRTSELSRVMEEGSLSEMILEEDEDYQDDNEYQEVGEKKVVRDDLKNPYWMEEKVFKNSPILFLSDQETEFWEGLIQKYLYPLDSNPEKEAAIAGRLKDLRDKVMFMVLMLNAIFILTIFLLQLNRDKLSITLPFRFDLVKPATVDTDYIDEAEEEVNNKLEPVGASFILGFAVILLLQTIGMFKHRLSTFSHILAFVKLDFFQRRKQSISDDDYIEQNAIEIAKDLQCLRGIDEEDNRNDIKNKATLERKNTIYNLEKKKKGKDEKTLTLDVAFRKRFLSISTRDKEGLNQLPGSLRRRQAIQALERRRESLASSPSLPVTPITVRTNFAWPYNRLHRYHYYTRDPWPPSRSGLTNSKSMGYTNYAFKDETLDDPFA